MNVGDEAAWVIGGQRQEEGEGLRRGEGEREIKRVSNPAEREREGKRERGRDTTGREMPSRLRLAALH